jgi:hypothetical protein
MADPFAPRSMKRKNVKGLALKAAAPRPPPTAETNHHEYSGSQDAGKDEQLEIGIEYKLDLRPEDLEILKELGSGNGGTVSKVKHLTTGTVMARKVCILCHGIKGFCVNLSGRLFMWRPSEKYGSELFENSRLCTAATLTTS